MEWIKGKMYCRNASYSLISSDWIIITSVARRTNLCSSKPVYFSEVNTRRYQYCALIRVYLNVCVLQIGKFKSLSIACFNRVYLKPCVLQLGKYTLSISCINCVYLRPCVLQLDKSTTLSVLYINSCVGQALCTTTM